MDIENIIKKLEASVAEQPKSSYVDYDFNLDQSELQCAARALDWEKRSYLWILRDSGTQLVELCAGVNPSLVQFWTQLDERENRQYRYYLITSNGVRQVSRKKAHQLADQAPALQAVTDIMPLLSRYPMPPFMSMPEPTQENWPQWRKFLLERQHAPATALVEKIDRLLGRHQKECA